MIGFLNELINKHRKGNVKKTGNSEKKITNDINEEASLNYATGPVGEERSLPDNPERKFYEPRSDLFEVWIDNKKFGITEKQIDHNNSSSSLNNITLPTYKTYLNDNTFVAWKRHNDIYQAINWLYDEYESQMNK